MEQILGQYQMDVLLGEGGFGKVFKAVHKKTGEVVAVKILDISYEITLADKIS